MLRGPPSACWVPDGVALGSDEARRRCDQRVERFGLAGHHARRPTGLERPSVSCDEKPVLVVESVEVDRRDRAGRDDVNLYLADEQLPLRRGVCLGENLDGFGVDVVGDEVDVHRGAVCAASYADSQCDGQSSDQHHGR